MEDNHSIRGFKGFDKDLSCRGFQYEVGGDYSQIKSPKAHYNGFHFCENPLQVLDYYSPNDSRYCEVYGSSDIDRAEEDDSLMATSHINIAKEVGVDGLVNAGRQYIIAKIDTQKPFNKQSLVSNRKSNTSVGSFCYKSISANYGAYAKVTNAADNSIAASVGNSSMAYTIGGWSIAANCGGKSFAICDKSLSIACNCGQSSIALNNGRNSASITSGGKSIAKNFGDCGMSCCLGDSSLAESHGIYSVALSMSYGSVASVDGHNSVAIAFGGRTLAKGTIGNWIVLTQYDFVGDIKDIKAFKIDGVRIKENTTYKLVDGQAVEVN